ncbi:cysteine methyltransferase [Pyrococcus furiosus DSM 3638]|uniref:Methylated-DNA--protein-cysteine methyltransferase n=3 Tax=Pyrococcus furiosus TaxID=2261 RepID=OGT_PYRFU|nr:MULTISPECIES: protein O6-alkylguanine-DNA alkyltransferase domain-containing protein [Pyrococcus]Q8TZV2.1 RecName: Full=Methylated-DNA--protein-cysteine methyltransferase; AltName: Full=6-O-methylguanine-DNA methyltransferase; Short=MGMT; AltName: Full=O-6-methylguanine-DNA-alkyltransferase [Pyrococcus furiosus DSM 3638]AAL82002.1 methylated DNA protein cysteine methyltransferase [Pyrococcus furiosus DSM 3638]AFN04762.1 methylated-DNA--protein-cysteine methyltransferase [Pyrococcus furiosus C
MILEVRKFQVKNKAVYIGTLSEDKIFGIIFSIDEPEVIRHRIPTLINFLEKRLNKKLEIKEGNSGFSDVVFKTLIGKISNEEAAEFIEVSYLTKFERKLYIYLVENVKRGEVITYGELAKILNTSSRAVGAAVKRNPYPIIVPCHRVIGRKNPYLYTPKPEYKKFLLEVEGWTS